MLKQIWQFFRIFLSHFWVTLGHFDQEIMRYFQLFFHLEKGETLYERFRIWKKVRQNRSKWLITSDCSGESAVSWVRGWAAANLILH